MISFVLDLIKSDKYKSLVDFLKNEYSHHVIYPDKKDVFRAFKLCPLSKLKVVIIGQDPYHQPNQADGLCFSVRNKNIPPSLRNIYKEINNEFGYVRYNQGDLSSWAQQGVLLINNVLTVRYNCPKSHNNHGWEDFTTEILLHINSVVNNVVYLLWGNDAKSKLRYISKKDNLILTSSHPSPLSVHNGFFGNKHFLITNEYLVKHNKTPIIW